GCRDRSIAGAPRTPTPPLHEGVAVGRADRRSGPGGRTGAERATGRRAVAHKSADWLPVSSAVPQGAANLPDPDPPAAAAIPRRRHTRGGLPFPARKRRTRCTVPTE